MELDVAAVNIILSVLANALTALLASLGAKGKDLIVGGELRQSLEQQRTSLSTILQKGIESTGEKIDWNNPDIHLFLDSPEVASFIHELFSLKLLNENTEYSVTEKRKEFQTTLTHFFDWPESRLSYTSDLLFDILFEGCEQALNIAIDNGILSAHEAKSNLRHHILLEEIRRKHDSPTSGQEIEHKFAHETEKALRHIRSEIIGIGNIERPEVKNIENQLSQLRKVVLVGDAGTGKSGIAAVLALSALNAGKIVLLLDARTISHIHDEAELKSYLELDCPVNIAIQEAADYKGCRLIIDQLDNVLGSRTAELLVNLVSAWCEIIGLEIAVISRRNTNHNRADEITKLTKKGFVEQTSNLLDEVTTRNAITSLDISDPSTELVRLASNLLYLETISLIRQETPTFAQFSSLTNEVMLWDRYLESIIDREAIGRGRDYANSIIAEAKRIARSSLINGETEFSLDDPLNQQQRRLEGTLLIHRFGRVFSFRHEELQYFLYAKNATETIKMPADISQEIRHNARNVLPWMKKIYFQQSGQSEYAAELYTRFLRESFYGQ